MIGALVIILAWILNAMMDAIDHGKGSRTLYELWHILKAVSYGVLMAYIVYLEQWSIWLIGGVLILLMNWWLVYEVLRAKHFEQWDDKITIKWLQWIWGINRR